jgi:hypothetical protein
VIALTQKDVLAHEAVVPWSEPYQVEQDLLLCLAMRAIFEDRFLSKQVAMRGEVVGNSVELFATSSVLGDTDQTYLYGITDNLSATSASQVTGEDFTTLAAAPADSDFKGVAFAPVPLPPSVTMLLGGLGLFGSFAVRRGSRRR